MSTLQSYGFRSSEIPVDIIESMKMALAKMGKYPKAAVPSFFPSPTSVSSIPIAKYPVWRLVTDPLATRVKKIESLAKPVQEADKDKIKRVKRELIEAGITRYGLLKAEGRNLHKVLHSNEHVEAIVYGQHRSNSVMLVATDERILYLDAKPMAVFLDEVSYEVVSGIEFEIHLFFASVILHTPVKNYDLKYVNLRCAEKFARHIEARRLMREQPEKEKGFEDEYYRPHRVLEESYPGRPKEDLAGYTWLPLEEDEDHQYRPQLLSENETQGAPTHQ